LNYAGIGMAMLALIESTVRATIKHNESEPNASEAATAWANRDEATGPRRPSKPTAPDDRIMVEFPSRPNFLWVRRITHDLSNLTGMTGNIAAAGASKVSK
jgi:hypothetical protein